MATGEARGRARHVTLLFLLKDFIVAVATRRPAPKAMATRQCLHGCSFRFHFPHSFVDGCECSHCHYASRDTGTPSRSHSYNPSGSPALKSLPCMPV